MAVNWGTKDPDERFEVEHDWGPRFVVDGTDPNDPILTDQDADPANHPLATVEAGGLVIDQIVMIPDSYKVQYWISGGTADQSAEVLLQITSAAGRRFQERAKIKIKTV